MNADGGAAGPTKSEMSAGFRLLGEDTLHDGPIISLRRAKLADPDGNAFEREVVRHPGAVSVVPLLEDHDGADRPVVVMLRQYRAAIDLELLEIPAGKRDVAEEPPEATAHRELAEEVGFAAGSLELLARFYNSPGFSDEHSFTFLARHLTAVDVSPQGVEERHMAVEHVALDDVATMIADGRLTDAKSIIALLLTLRRLGR